MAMACAISIAFGDLERVQTLRLVVEKGNPESEASRQAIARAAEILRAGGTVAFPTETVYGLGANALDEQAVRKIFEAKERPGWDPLIVHIGERELLGQVAETVSEAAERLMDRFWPGPLTLLLPKHPDVPEIVTAGLARIGVRMPAHPVARSLLIGAGIPVAAPSANRFGRTSATTADHVAGDLVGRIDAILDGGETTHGVESTVVDVRPATGGDQEDLCMIYRPGVITVEQIEEVSRGPVVFRTQIGAGEAGAAPAPGMGDRHYAPRARMVLVDGVGPDVASALAETVNRCEEAGDVVGILLPEEFRNALLACRTRRGAEPELLSWNWGRWDQPEQLAQRLYAGLRHLDAAGATAIVCPLPEAAGIGVAIRDRLQRAARK
jgi:L-threonylcarbamoyladenylate synthase